MKKFAVAVVLVALLAPVAVAQEAPEEARPGLVQRALSWLGVPYRFGGQDEKKGFDCAGLVRRVFSTVAVDLPRTAAAQFRQGCIVQREELQPGDLVFFRDTYKHGISHVGIYIGTGQFVHAPSSRRSVSIDRLDSPYFDRRFAGGRRLTIAAVVPPIPGAELGMP
ncbi:MAG TPA: C40 family peptidase [Thermoanaerobaculia bacterium]